MFFICFTHNGYYHQPFISNLFDCFFFNVKLKKYKKMKLIFGGCVTRAKLDLCDIRRKLRGLLMTRHNVLR
jgi:hypothetical protein